MIAPKCYQTGNIMGRDDRGRSVRCAECLTIAVHPFGLVDEPYVHWTDTIPDGSGRTWMDVSSRNSFGRLRVPVVDPSGTYYEMRIVE
jgi:hypothetical protein